jgi:hypothetical protein
MIGISHYNLVNAHNVLCTYMLRRFSLLSTGSMPCNLLFPRNLITKETIHASIQKGVCWDVYCAAMQMRDITSKRVNSK